MIKTYENLTQLIERINSLPDNESFDITIVGRRFTIMSRKLADLLIKASRATVSVSDIQEDEDG